MYQNLGQAHAAFDGQDGSKVTLSLQEAHFTQRTRKLLVLVLPSDLPSLK